MAPKRKSRIKTETKQSKKPKEENEERKCTNAKFNTSIISKPFSSVKCDRNHSGVLSKHETGDSHSGTIMSFFRKQQLEDSKTVMCPVCKRMVFFKKINQHLDNGCCEESPGLCEKSIKMIMPHPQQHNNFNTSGCKKKNISSDIKSGEQTDNSLREDNINNSVIAIGGNASTNGVIHDAICILDSTGSSLKTTDHSVTNKAPTKFSPRNLKVQEVAQQLSGYTKEDTEYKDKVNLFKDDVDDEVVSKINLDEVTSDALEGTISETGTGNDPKNDVKGEIDNPNFLEPYYLQNFNLTINTVLSHKDDRELFNEEDNKTLKLFQDLSEGAKKLYVRLFQRKFKWFQIVKIQYPKIGENLEQFFQELIDRGFLQTEDRLHDLEEILKLLPASDIQKIAKSMHIINKNQGETKKNLTQMLINHSKKQCSLFANNGNRIAKAIVEKSKGMLGSCVKLEPLARTVFSRIILLFSLNMLADDDDNAGSQLSALFLINIGKVIYPSYEISRETPLFCSRDELIKYELANEDLFRVEDAMENKKFDEARRVYENVRTQFNEVLFDLANNREQTVLHSFSLPIHLRRFTSVWVYTRICSRGVELLQRDKDYSGAVELLRKLLGQNKFYVNRCGWWWERLALNLDQHLKNPTEALNAVLEGLLDVRVRTGHRFALEQRAKKICEAKRNSSLHQHLIEIKFTELKQPNVVTISGKRLSNEPVFVLHEINSDGSIDNNVVSYCGVEEMALRYYRQQGYDEGIHGEGATFNTFFGLLLWEVIFTPGIPDVFRTPFQMAPLDIYCDNFYGNRKEMIDKRLNEICNASIKELTDWIDSAWTEHYGKTCVGVSWDLFSGVEQIKRLASCIGGCVLAGICRKFAEDYRHTRSGLPDLVVWNSNTLKYKIVEVKGPNDRLSTKQHVWLDVLVALEIDTEVLYVKAVGGRKIT